MLGHSHAPTFPCTSSDTYTHPRSHAHASEATCQHAFSPTAAATKSHLDELRADARFTPSDIAEGEKARVVCACACSACSEHVLLCPCVCMRTRMSVRRCVFVTKCIHKPYMHARTHAHTHAHAQRRARTRGTHTHGGTDCARAAQSGRRSASRWRGGLTRHSGCSRW